MLRCSLSDTWEVHLDLRSSISHTHMDGPQVPTAQRQSRKRTLSLTLGKVAEKSSVCRSPARGMSSPSTMRRICSENTSRLN